MNRRELLRQKLLQKRGISNPGRGGVPLSPELMAELGNVREERVIANKPYPSPPPGAPAGFRQPPPGYTGEGDLDPSPGLPGRGYIDPAPAPAAPTMGWGKKWAMTNPPRPYSEVMKEMEEDRRRNPDQFVDLPPAEDTIPPDPKIVGESEQPNFTGGREYGLDLPEMAETETPIVTNRGNHPGDPVPEGETDPRARMKDYLSEQIKRRRFASPELLRDGRNLQGENGVAGALSRAAASFGQVGGKGPVSTFDVAEANSGIDATIKDAHLRDKGVDDEQDRAIKLAALRQKLAAKRGGFALSKDQKRFEIDEATGEYKEVASNPGSRSGDDYQVVRGNSKVRVFRRSTGELVNEYDDPMAPMIGATLDDPNTGEKILTDKSGNEMRRYPGKIPLTDAQKAHQKKVGETAAEVDMGGLEDMKTHIASLNKAAAKLEALAKSKKWTDSVVSGNQANLFPNSWRNAINPEVEEIKSLVDSVTVLDLKRMLGAQFTEKDRIAFERLGFNPGIDEAENAQRIRQKAQLIERLMEAKKQTAGQFQRAPSSGASGGWNSQPERIGGESGGNPPPHGMRVKQKGVPFIWNGSKYVPE